MHRPALGDARALVVTALIVGCSPEDPAPRPSPPALRDGSASAPASRGWSEHVSTACGFAVELPTAPLQQPVPAGLLDQIGAEDHLHRVALLASCGDVPSVGSANEFLRVTSQVIARHWHATIEQTTRVELQGRTGLELLMTIPAANKPPTIPWPGALGYRMRLYVAGHRQYQLNVLYPEADAAPESAERFFAGFRLLDDAPPALAPLAWSTHAIGALTVEAPGLARASTPDPSPPELVTHVRFGDGDRSTPFALHVWTADPVADLEEPIARLRAHFLRRIATERTEIVSEAEARVAGRPALDIRYRPHIPLPEHLAGSSRQTRAAVKDLIARNPSEFLVRLVPVGDRVVQLTTTEPDAREPARRFLDSLTITASPPRPR